MNPIAWVDFNEVIEEDGDMIVSTLFKHIHPSMRVGDHVIVGDYEGNHCDAKLIREQHGWAVFRLYLLTFTGPDE